MVEHQVLTMSASSRGNLAFHREASDLQAAKAADIIVLSFLKVRLSRLFQMCHEHSWRNVSKCLVGKWLGGCISLSASIGHCWEVSIYAAHSRIVQHSGIQTGCAPVSPLQRIPSYISLLDCQLWSGAVGEEFRKSVSEGVVSVPHVMPEGSWRTVLQCYCGDGSV